MYENSCELLYRSAKFPRMTSRHTYRAFFLIASCFIAMLVMASTCAYRSNSKPVLHSIGQVSYVQHAASAYDGEAYFSASTPVGDQGGDDACGVCLDVSDDHSDLDDPLALVGYRSFVFASPRSTPPRGAVTRFFSNDLKQILRPPSAI